MLIQAFYPKAYEITAGKKVKGEIELRNLIREAQTIDVWLEVYKGKGEGGPKGGPISNKFLLKGWVFSPQIPRMPIEFKLNLPSEPKNYTVQLKVGTYPDTVIDTRWFTVEVK